MSISRSAVLAIVLCVLGVARGEGAVKEAYQQCGGEGYLGSRECVEDFVCRDINNYYSQCLPVTRAELTPAPPEATGSGEYFDPSSSPSAAMPWIHMCSETGSPDQNPLSPSSSRTPPNSTLRPTQTIYRRGSQRPVLATVTVSTPKPSTTSPESDISFPPPRTCSIAPPPANPAPLSYKGMNIAGFNFAINSSGSSTNAAIVPPITELGGPDGAAQMRHFVRDIKHNIFRLPVTWQYLTGGKGGGVLDEAAWARYDQLVGRCIESKAMRCIVDLHNFGRYEGKIIGQGGPSNDDFAALWGSIATRYANLNNTRIMFGLMNEPHEIPNPLSFFRTIQAAVTAIRNAGASSHTILIPSMDWSAAATFQTNVGGGPTLVNVKNPDGTTKDIVFDVHAFSKGEFAAEQGDCPRTNVSTTFLALSQFLRCYGRKALVTAVGGLNSKECLAHVCGVTDFIKANSDVYLGYVGWSAGSYDSTHPLGLAPTLWSNGWKDAHMVTLCLK